MDIQHLAFHLMSDEETKKLARYLTMLWEVSRKEKIVEDLRKD